MASPSDPRRTRMFLLVGAGTLVGGVLLVVVSNLDRGTGHRSPGSGADGQKPRIADPSDIVAPTPLSVDDRENSGREFSRAQLDEGAWVQVADENGRLSQQYSAKSLTPLKGHELDLDTPTAVFYQPDGRVITLSADRGRARVPKRAIERGTLDGNVKIRVYRPAPGATVDLKKDEPVMLVDADQAEFDSIVIRCDGPVHLESAGVGSFDGTGLAMILNPTTGALEKLTIDRCTQPIEFARGGERGMSLRPKRVAAVAQANSNEGAGVAQPVDRSEPAATPKDGDAPARTAPQSAPQRTPAERVAVESTPAANARAAEARFYELTLLDEVVVRRTREGKTTTLRGDVLAVVFAMEGESAFDRVAVRDRAEPNATAGHAVTPLQIVSSAVLAGTRSDDVPSGDPANELITITYTGRLELVPLDAARLKGPDALATTDDMSVSLSSNAGKSVSIDDEATSAKVICDRVSYRSDRDRIDAWGRVDRPLQVRSPQMKAEGEHFWLVGSGAGGQATGGGSRGGFQGPGSVDLASGGKQFAALAFDPSTMVVSTASNDAIVATVLALPNQAAPTDAAVNVAWSTSLDLQFTPTQGSTGEDVTGAIQSATFVGDVRARGERFTLDAAELATTFAPKPAADGASDGASSARFLTRLLATGTADAPARATRTDGGGSLSATTLDLSLRADKQGDAVPASLVATNAVEARDRERTLWTSSLTVDFTDPATAAARPARTNDESLVEADVSKVTGREGVQALIRAVQNNAEPWTPVRVYADALDGDGLAGTLALSGNDVWVVRDTLLADSMKAIRFAETTRMATSEGPGRVRVFPQPLIAPEEQSREVRLERPTPSPTHALLAEWKNGFSFDERAAEAGSLLLRGAVRVRSTPDPYSTDGVDAESLKLDLAPKPAAGGATATTIAEQAGLRRIEARGAATFLSIKRQSARRGDQQGDQQEAPDPNPRLLRLKGEEIHYDLLTREGNVVGAGELFTNIPEGTRDGGSATPAEAPLAAGETTTKGAPRLLGVVGTTRFQWQSRLDLTRLPPAAGSEQSGDGAGQAPRQFRVVMQDGVRMEHTGPALTGAPNAQTGASETLVLEAARLEADFEDVDPPVDAGTPRPGAERGINLTGTAKMLAVRASTEGANRVRVNTEDISLICDRFVYDVATQIAILTAEPGSTVTLVEHQRAARTVASSIEWNLATGTIRIRDAAG